MKGRILSDAFELFGGSELNYFERITPTIGGVGVGLYC